ncbi:MAG TPA: hypothetical protein DCS93_04205 [Microscillaceae bacterium]|nr:hypothetical protein [Microscillaceae bacterium]
MQLFDYVKLLFIACFLLIGFSLQATAQPTVVGIEIKKGNFDFAPASIEVPLNAFQIVLTFDQAVQASNNTPIDSPVEALEMLVLKAATHLDAPDIFESTMVQSIQVNSGAPQNSIITIDVVFTQDLLPGQTYTLALDETKVLSAIDGQFALPYSKQFTTASAVTIVPGIAAITQLCQGEVTELSPIVLAENSNYSFVPQTQGVLELTLGDVTNFEFTGNMAQVSVLGGSGVTALVIAQNNTHISIQYDIGSDAAKSHALSISGVRIRFKGNTSVNTDIIASNTSGRYNLNGLYSGNTSVILGTVTGRGSIIDDSLNPGALNGPNSLCLGSSALYTVPPIGGATHYEWTVPNNFQPKNALLLNGNVWQTTENFITLEAINTNFMPQVLSVQATNNCRRSDATASPILVLNAQASTPAVNLNFEAPGLGIINGSGTTKSIANALDSQTITLNTPTSGTVIFSGPGMVGNTFHPNIASLGINTIRYVFTNNNGCITTGSFMIDVFDASVAINNLQMTYCDNEEADQEFMIKASINGTPILTSNISLMRLSPNPMPITSSGTPYPTGFGLKISTATDHVLVLKPNLLGTGTYRITIDMGLNNITREFTVNAAPNPIILGATAACANSSSTYSVIQNNNHTYAWSLSGGGTPLAGNGSSITINWTPSVTEQIFTLTMTETNTETQCVKTVSQSIAVQAQPTPEIEGPDRTCANSTQNYRVKGGAVAGHTYLWDVTGGVISNSTSDQVTVSWSNAASGVIQLIDINAETCQASVSQAVTINPPSIPIFITGANQVCALSENEKYTINPVNATDLLIWEVEGGSIIGGSQSGGISRISGIGLSEIAINWREDTQGVITVTEVDANNCNGTSRYMIRINPLPRLAFSGFSPQYCNNSSAVFLTPIVNGDAPLQPANTRFVVRDESNAIDLFVLASEIFSPQELFATQGSGNYNMVLEYTDIHGCSNSSVAVPFRLDNAPQNVRLNISQIDGSPKVTFNADADNIDDNSQWQWTWRWAGGFQVASIQQNDTLNLLNTRRQEITYSLKLENNVGCDETITRTFFIDFGVRGTVLNRPTLFNDLTRLNTFSIDSWHWDFGDGQTSNLQNPRHTYNQVGSYKVTLSITQGFITYTLKKQVNIFPLIVVNPDKPYLATFDQGGANWTNYGTIIVAGQIIERNSWKLQSLESTQNITAQPGNRVWITNNQNDPIFRDINSHFYNDEQSYVESPFFDITALNHPMVRFRYWSDMDQGSDGVVLLYTIDDGNTWHRLGEKGEGINWYNRIFILGNPGRSSSTNTQITSNNWTGWSGNIQTTDNLGWKVAHLSLEDVKRSLVRVGITDQRIRLRLALGSNGDTPSDGFYEGFAFDDFELLNQNRQVLWEYFGNQKLSQDDKTAHEVATSHAQAINIHYHLDYPAKDTINEQNPHDPSGRAFYYGIGDVSRLALDGKINDQTDWVSQAKERYLKRILLQSPFEINIKNPQINGSILSVSTTIKALENFNQSVIIQVVVIDINVTINDTIFHNAMRKMLPDAAGTFRSDSWVKGESQKLEFNWNFGSLDPNSFKVVVFVQDYITKEVYQAQISTQTINQRGSSGGKVTSLQDYPDASNIRVFPNPVSESLHVSLLPETNPDKKLQWQIISTQGRVLQIGEWQTIKKESSSFELNLKNLAHGIYILKFSNGYSFKFEKK